MANTAILAIRIISDAKSAAKGFQDVETRSERMGRRTNTAAKVAAGGLALFAVAGVSAAKAAAADEAGASRLASALRKNAGASKASIAATEEWISKQSAAKGVADDELRPALATLVRQSGNVAKSQRDLGLAMDISAATGKPLAAVSAALAKGYGGNAAALGKMVPGLDKATLKSGNMAKITAELAKKVGGDAADAAQTNEGKMRRMAIATGELQEQFGAFLLPVLGVVVSVLAGLQSWVSRNSTAAAVLVGSIAALAAAVIAINVAFKLYTTYTRAAALATKLLNAAQKANTMFLVIAAIVVLVGLLVLAYKRSSTFRAILQALGRAGQAALGWVVSAAKNVWTWLGKLGPAANVAKNVAVRAFKLYTTPIRTLIDLVSRLVGWISNIHWPKAPAWVSKVGSLFGGPSSAAAGGRVPAHGRGGPSSGSMFSSIGGRGGMGAVVYIQVQGAVDKVGTAKQIAGLLRDQGLRVGEVRI